MLILFAVLIAILGGFSLYAHFLVDYSLETLAFALDTTDKKAEEESSMARQVYRGMVQDLVSDQIGNEKADLKDLALLEMASRSFDESTDRDGYARAKIYLSQVVEHRKKPDNIMQQMAGGIYEHVLRVSQFVGSFADYLKRRVFPEKTEKKENYEYSSIYLLEQAQGKEKKLEFHEASEFYREFLGLYPTHTDRGYVKIALAQALMKEKRIGEAKKLLGDVQIEFGGREEQKIASKLLNRLSALKDKEKAVHELKENIKKVADPSEKKKLQIKLAVTYLSLGQVDTAEGLLTKLIKAEDPEVARQAKFYMAWVYKMKKQYGEGGELIEELLQDKNLGSDLELGLRAQLADIYYQKGDVKASLFQYKTLSEKVSNLPAGSGKQELLDSKGIKEAWKSLSEMEQANIYLFDLQDSAKAQEHLEAAGGALSTTFNIKELQERMKAAASNSLRDKGFLALKSTQVGLAFELFNRNLKLHPDDAWTHSGLATVYILLGILDGALTAAQDGHQLDPDAYTTSVLAYVYDVSGKNAEAIAFYEKALFIRKDYFAASYNLSCVLLKTGQYEQSLALLNKMNHFSAVEKQTNLRVRILNNKGCALWHLGKKEEALKMFNEALELKPNFGLVKKNLNLIFVSGKSPEGSTVKENVLEPQN